MNRTRIRSILLAHGFRVPDGMADLREYVYEAVAAVLAETAAPEGWRLVPEHPTPEMLAALRIGSRRDAPSDELCEVRYRAMLANVPEPPVRNPAEIEHEPVAWLYTIKDEDGKRLSKTPPEAAAEWNDIANAEALYLRPPTLRLPEPMTDAEMMRALGNMTGLDLYDVWRRAEAETLRRVKECNK